MSIKRYLKWGIVRIRRVCARWAYRCKYTYYEWIARPRRYWQRARRGWSDDDTYNMDVTLAEIIGGMLHYIAETDSSYPGRLPSGEKDNETPSQQGLAQEWTHDSWKAYLDGLAFSFDAYVLLHKGEDAFRYSAKDSEQVIQQMRGLFDYYRHLWT